MKVFISKKIKWNKQNKILVLLIKCTRDKILRRIMLII